MNNFLEKQNILLICMLLTYITPITYVYLNYYDNKSVSNIICDEQHNFIILISMIIMSFLTILYERGRDNTSLLIIILLFYGIFGVLCTEETQNIHYLYASIVLMAMITFMVYHCNHKNCNILYMLILLQFTYLISIFIHIQQKQHIFLSESLYFMNFAVFYLYLHFL